LHFFHYKILKSIANDTINDFSESDRTSLIFVELAGLQCPSSAFEAMIDQNDTLFRFDSK
jgi:hypothetical protein